MIARRFVDGSLTVQAGGNDLTFPHHDLGAAIRGLCLRARTLSITRTPAWSVWTTTR